MIQPFDKIDGMTTTKYLGWFVSDSKDKSLPDRDRYKVLVEIDPWGKLISCNCECKGFRFNRGKKLCKHLSNEDESNPGILQELKQWEEIEEIPILDVGDKE